METAASYFYCSYRGPANQRAKCRHFPERDFLGISRLADEDYEKSRERASSPKSGAR
jgi:hypothetical protein